MSACFSRFTFGSWFNQCSSTLECQYLWPGRTSGAQHKAQRRAMLRRAARCVRADGVVVGKPRAGVAVWKEIRWWNKIVGVMKNYGILWGRDVGVVGSNWWNMMKHIITILSIPFWWMCCFFVGFVDCEWVRLWQRTQQWAIQRLFFFFFFSESTKSRQKETQSEKHPTDSTDTNKNAIIIFLAHVNATWMSTSFNIHHVFNSYSSHLHKPNSGGGWAISLGDDVWLLSEPR